MARSRVVRNPVAALSLDQVQDLLAEKRAEMPYGYKLPYMQWYEEDFKASEGVEEMHPLERLMYRQLLAKAWVSKNAPYLPSDDSRLQRLADCPDESMWAKHGRAVKGMFHLSKDGDRLFHPRQLLDYTKQIFKLSSCTENGQRGGRPKADKQEACGKENPTETERLHLGLQNENPTERQLELEPELEPESTPSSESNLEIPLSGEEDEDFSEEQNTDCIAEEDDVKADKQIDIICTQFFGRKANLSKWNLEGIRRLELLHKGSAVVRAFGEWANENSDDPDIKDPVAKFLQVADDLLSTDTSAQVAAKDPEAVKVTREITYLSGGEVSFSDKHRVRISELLREYSFEEIVGAWKEWVQNQDSEPKFLAGKFVQAADDVCYAARRKAQERAAEALVREETARRLQEAAEAERRAQDAAVVEEYDPLSAL